MVHVLAEVRPPNAILGSIYAKVFHPDVPCLVLNKLNRLEFSVVVTEPQASLNVIETLPIEDPIVCMEKFEHPNLERDVLVLLTESNVLLFLWFDVTEQKFVILNSVILDASNQKSPIDSSPKVIMDPNPEPRFFLVFFFEGFIQAFIINQKWDRSPITAASGRYKRKLHKEELVKEITFSIGAISTQDIMILKGAGLDSNNRTVAILYRDYNFNYSFRYYSFNLSDLTFKLLKQFDEFGDAPTSMVSPMDGGILIFTDSFIFYFPGPETKSLDISEENQDENLSCNSSNLTITKKLSSVLDDSDISAFHCSTIIDQKRILLIDNKGQTFILFFDLDKKTSTTLHMRSLSLISLGLSTVPTSVHHVYDGFFLVTSKFSQYLLFQILAQQPYINIVKFFESSPPVLDIQPYVDSTQNALLTCQGGLDSGEFRKVSSQDSFLKLVKSFHSSVSGQKIAQVEKNETSLLRVVDMVDKQEQLVSVKGNSSYSLLKTKATDALVLKKDRDCLLEIRESEVRMNEAVVNEVQVSKYASLSATEFIVLDNRNDLFVYSEVLLHTVKLGTQAEVSTIDMVRVFGQEYLILVSYWDGSYTVILISPDEQEVILDEKLTSGGVPIISCCLVHDKSWPNTVWIFLVTSNNDLVQICFNFRERRKEPYKIAYTHLEGSPYKFVKDEHNVIVFNKKSILGFHFSESVAFHKVFDLGTGNDDLEIIDACLFGDDKMAVLSKAGEVNLYAINETDPTKDVLFSNTLNQKVITIGEQAVLLKSKNVFVESTSEYVRNSILQVIDVNTMRPVDTFEFPDSQPVEIVDVYHFNTEEVIMGEYENEDTTYIVAVCNSEDIDKLLMIFSVKDNKILQLPTCKVSGIVNPTKLEPYSIRLFDKDTNSYIISGSMNFIAKPASLLDWTVNSDSVYPSAVYSVSAAVTKGRLILADVMTGITTASLLQKSDGSYTLSRSSISQHLQASFLTGLVCMNTGDQGDIVLVADLLGNLWGIRESIGNKEDTEEETDPFNEIISFSIGDPINVVNPLPKPRLPQDFGSYFDGFSDIEVVLTPKVVIGTVNGAIYTLSDLADVDEEIEEIVTKCCREIIMYKSSLSDIYYTNKRDKWARYTQRKGKKLLQQDENGIYLRQDTTGIIDLTVIQNWLERDAIVNKAGGNDKLSEESANMQANLKVCYKNKNLLQRLVLEASYV